MATRKKNGKRKEENRSARAGTHSTAMKDLGCAEPALRRHAAAWVAAIRSRIAALAAEVRAVAAEINPSDGSVLGRVLDDVQVGNVLVSLEEADCEACSLVVTGVDLPVPNLLALAIRTQRAG
jgi:hypothetical protein